MSPGLFLGGSGVCGGVYSVSGGYVSKGAGSVGCDHMWVEWGGGAGQNNQVPWLWFLCGCGIGIDKGLDPSPPTGLKWLLFCAATHLSGPSGPTSRRSTLNSKWRYTTSRTRGINSVMVAWERCTRTCMCWVLNITLIVVSYRLVATWNVLYRLDDDDWT